MSYDVEILLDAWSWVPRYRSCTLESATRIAAVIRQQGKKARVTPHPPEEPENDNWSVFSVERQIEQNVWQPVVSYALHHIACEVAAKAHASEKIGMRVLQVYPKSQRASREVQVWAGITLREKEQKQAWKKLMELEANGELANYTVWQSLDKGWVRLGDPFLVQKEALDFIVQSQKECVAAFRLVAITESGEALRLKEYPAPECSYQIQSRPPNGNWAWVESRKDRKAAEAAVEHLRKTTPKVSFRVIEQRLEGQSGSQVVYESHPPPPKPPPYFYQTAIQASEGNWLPQGGRHELLIQAIKALPKTEERDPELTYGVLYYRHENDTPVVIHLEPALKKPSAVAPTEPGPRRTRRFVLGEEAL